MWDGCHVLLEASEAIALDLVTKSCMTNTHRDIAISSALNVFCALLGFLIFCTSAVVKSFLLEESCYRRCPPLVRVLLKPTTDIDGS